MNRSQNHPKDEHLSYLLTAYAFENLSEAGRLEVERHLESCAECRNELEEIRGTVSSVRGAYPETAPGGASTFEARKLERVIAAARSRRRGRIVWIAWPVGAAAATLFVVLVIGSVTISSRGLPVGARRTMAPPAEYTELAAGDGFASEEFKEGQPGPSSGAIQPTALAAPQPTAPASARPTASAATPPTAPAASPAPPQAAEPAQVAQSLGSTLESAKSTRMRRAAIVPEGVYRELLSKDEHVAAALEGSAPAGGAGLPAVLSEAPPAPAKPAEVGQADDPTRNVDARRQAVPTDGWGRKVAGRALGEATEHFGGIVVDAPSLAFEDPAKAEEVRAGIAAGGGTAGADGGVQNGSRFYDESARGRDKAPAKHLEALRAGLERKESEKAAQKADELADANALRDRSDFAVPVSPHFAPPEAAAIRDAEVAFFANTKTVEDLDKDLKLKVLEDTQANMDGFVTTFEWSEAKKRTGLDLMPALAVRSSRERVLRSWAHWKALDAGLSLEGFEARRLDVPPPSPGGEGLAAEEFRKRYGVNPFVDTRLDAHSTFGMDVDTASYTIARGALAAGTLPGPDQVRVEEFVNYFPEPVPASKEGVFAVGCEGGPSLFGKGLDLLKITIRARDIAPGERKDAVLTLAVDTSGSMHHGGRLALVRQALGALVASLEPGDRVAIVGFGDHPYLVLPHTSAREAERILDALESLAPRGDTNFEAGLDLAYRVADEALEPRAVNRIILCSDGVATSGARGPEELLGKIEAYARRGIYLSTLGVGLGKYNDRLLEMLADRGNGSYAYADDATAAADVFQKNLPGALQVLARDAKIQVAFDPAVVARYRLLGYENRDIADKDFRNDQVDAGEVGPGTTVTVLYEIERASGSSGDLGRIHLRYADTGTGRVEEEDYPLPPGVIATSVEASSGRFRFMACVAELAELLRESYWARDGSFGDVLAALLALGPEDRSRPEVREVLGLAARAQSLLLARLEGK